MAGENNNTSSVDDSWDSITADVQREHQQDGGDQGGDNQQQRDQGNDLDKLLDEHITTTGRQDGKTTQDQNKGQQRDGTQQGQQGQQRQDGGQQQDGQRQQGDGRTTQHSPVPQTPRKYGALFQSDTSGAIIDAAGRKIASPGMERRIFERIHHVFGTMEIEHATMKNKLEAYENADTAARDAGLNIEERAAGLRLMSAWKQDKVKTINFLLNQASQAGIDVSSIRGGGVDMSAIRTVLAEEVRKAVEPFQPFVQQQQSQTEMQQMAEEARAQLDEFHEQFPEARMHGTPIAAIMDKTGWNVREAFFALQAQAAKNGWDMSKPLAEQAQRTLASQNGGGGNSQRRPTGDGSQRLPPMNGRGGGNDGTVVQAGSRGAASANDSWDSIVAGTLDDLGIAH